MADKKEFPNGLMAKAPHENAPAFVKARVAIKVADLGQWLREQFKAGKEWVNLDLCEARSGAWYFSVNEFKKEDKPEPKGKQASGGGASDDIPFGPVSKYAP